MGDVVRWPKVYEGFCGLGSNFTAVNTGDVVNESKVAGFEGSRRERLMRFQGLRKRRLMSFQGPGEKGA